MMLIARIFYLGTQLGNETSNRVLCFTGERNPTGDYGSR
jgi:hypothetical protein